MVRHFPLALFQKLLLGWYKKNKRDLPWREFLVSDAMKYSNEIRNPYLIVVSELMLQQTQVSRVIPKFQAFIARWPTIEDLANAKLSEVIIEWKGLGYNRRAKHLLETAKIVTDKYQSHFPEEREALLRLPGFGAYMVSALRVFALGKQDAVIDVNVFRVIARVQNGMSRRKEEQSQIQEIAQQAIPKGKADMWHQALMDFGAMLCTAKAPLCTSCTLARICIANREAQENGYETYAEWLAAQPKEKKVSRKDIGKRFEETDRYFRGRIIEYLRTGSHPMKDVQTHVLIEHNLQDIRRFGSLIESLVIDGMIVVKGNTVSLA